MKDRLNEQEKEWIETTYSLLEKKISVECDRIGTKMPYIPVDGRYDDMGEKNITWWTNSFWAGILWQMYHATGEEKYAKNAIGTELRYEDALEDHTKWNHDLGFMWLHTGVAHYRLLKEEEAKKRALRAASLLADRFQYAGNHISAWNNKESSEAIVDCLMNLPLLYWGCEITGNQSWKRIAMLHADTALEKILRPDGSSNHVVSFDPVTGEVRDILAGQGYSKDSSWSRGISWAIYGMSLSYRYTGEQKYLDAAKRSAHYFLACAAVNDFDVVIDFRAPQQPVYYDNTAAVCAACGLLEISEHVGEYEKDLYVQGALKLLRGITEKFCNWNIQEDGIVTAGSARYQRASDREVPIVYGDYFLVEAVLRLTDKNFLIW